MPELDHVFVCCAEGAPEAAALSRLGLKEGSPNTHPGQGTASRRFFFSNAYLELLWVSDAQEVQRDEVRRTRLWDRWSGRLTGACPFAVILRPSATSADRELPFPAWTYKPLYLPPGLGIEVALGTPLEEPGLFYIPFARRPDASAALEITGVDITLPSARSLSAATRATEATGVVAFSEGDAYLMTLIFGSTSPRETADLRPELPLVLRFS